ncbi:uncharacterized protein isoform X1 [Choristoneura fumiferana]|uniref:uncharacterized protein isoform X1 n=1 Tax=Choristoneura fumiferana TaxID=7141 RepID=UPI003D15B46E
MLRSLLYLFIIDYFRLFSCIGMLGPADLIFKSFGVCEPEPSELSFKVVTKRYNRTTNVLDIDISTPYPLDDSIVLELNACAKKEGGYKPGSFHMKDKYCTVLKTMLGDLFDIILNIAGRDDCPIPEGTYEIHDFYFDNSKFTVPQIYGEYRTEGLVYKDDVLIACYYFFFDIIPKAQE